MKKLIKWDLFRPVLNGLFKGTKVGSYHVDAVLTAKMIVLQSWYALSDEHLERECNNRLLFQNFLSYSDIVPDARTVRLSRREVSTGMDREFWELLNLQLENLGKEVK